MSTYPGLLRSIDTGEIRQLDVVLSEGDYSPLGLWSKDSECPPRSEGERG